MKLLLVSLLLSIVAIAQGFQKPLISVEQYFESGDPVHFWADEYNVGTKVHVKLFNVQTGRAVASEVSTVYQYGEHHELDVHIPDVSSGYYSFKWDAGKSEALHVIKKEVTQ